MPWLQIWFVLVTLALTVLTLLGVRLWRQAKALTSALGEVSSRFGELGASLDRLGGERAQGVDSVGRAGGADIWAAYDRP